MKKTIYSRYDKNALNNLPVVDFDGRIIVVLTEAEAEKAVDYLLSADILGMDTETRPAFKRGQHFQVALLQVSTRDTCFLFRLNLIGLCPAVVRLLENTTVPMIGLSWHDDLRMLHHRGDFTPGLFHEIQDMVGDLGIKDLSLQKLYANLFGKKISKRQRLTNWEAPVLNDQQKVYASIDAWACIQLYEEINRLRDTGDYDLVVVPEPEPVQKAEPVSDPVPASDTVTVPEPKSGKGSRPAKKPKKPKMTEKAESKPKDQRKPRKKKNQPKVEKANDIQENIS